MDDGLTVLVHRSTRSIRTHCCANGSDFMDQSLVTSCWYSVLIATGTVYYSDLFHFRTPDVSRNEL